MARANSSLVALLAATIAMYGAAARSDAQTLARLHVLSFTLRAEPRTVRVGDVVRLRVAVRLAERVPRLNDVTLPDLSGFVSLGDERRCVPDGRGTLCAETLSLSPTIAGIRTIAPVTLDAVDAGSGRPSRFASNAARVDVLAPEPPSRLAAVADALMRFVWFASWAVLAIGLVLLGIWTLRRRPKPAPPSLPIVNDDVRDRAGERWPTLLAGLRAQPSRARVLAVRAFLRERLGAGPTETLGDLANRHRGSETTGTLSALALIERAAFVADAHVAAAALAALPALEELPSRHREHETTDAR